MLRLFFAFLLLIVSTSVWADPLEGYVEAGGGADFAIIDQSKTRYPVTMGYLEFGRLDKNIAIELRNIFIPAKTNVSGDSIGPLSQNAVLFKIFDAWYIWKPWIGLYPGIGVGWRARTPKDTFNKSLTASGYMRMVLDFNLGWGLSAEAGAMLGQRDLPYVRAGLIFRLDE